MFMRRYIKEGEMFKLDRPNSRQQQSANQIQMQTLEDMQDERNYQVNEVSARRKPQYPQFNVDQMMMNGNPAIAICGAIICCVCAIIGAALFYFVLFDYVKPYIPEFVYDYVPLASKPLSPAPLFLTELNAKQYFAHNQLIAGELHYARVPVEYWPHRIQMIKSMGFNALSVYVFWNYHEISKGKFDFQTKNKNLTLFLQIAKQYDMQVLLRPGPYVCAEWDMGGLPARLLNIQGIKLRSSDKLFIDETKIYFTELNRVIKNYIRNQKNPKGPILMIQVENQPSWYTSQKLYIDILKQLWEEINVGCALYFDDILDGFKNQTIYWDNAILAVNSELYKKSEYDKLQTPNHFIMSGEVYSGWFYTWGKANWQKRMTDLYQKKFLQQFQDLLYNKASFSMYVAHGGTNFGLTAGYNMTTSYDYTCPISQQGAPNQKYHIFRSLVLKYTDKVPPATPATIPTMSAEFGQTVALSSLFDNYPKAISIPSKIQPFVLESDELEMYNQGMVMYETNIKGPADYEFKVIIHDLAFVYVDGQYQQSIVRNKKAKIIDQEVTILKVKCSQPECKLEILVEAFGHLNFGKQFALDRKGLLRFQEKSSSLQTKLSSREWKHYKFELNDEPKWKNAGKCGKAPCLYYVEADLVQAKDTFINMKGFKKGYVWVNGYNLGRYWDVGPEYSLFCPGVWLIPGKNKILILDLYVANATISLTSQNEPVII